MATIDLNKLDKNLATDIKIVLVSCALDGAVRVNYSMLTSATGSKAALKYFDELNTPIGDDRDYHILKSCFNRLQALSETLAKRLIEHEAMPNHITNVKDDGGINIDDDININIDLDLKTGQMTVSVN